jgi:hypothetical protein
MPIIGSIQITWDKDGEVIWNLDFPYKDPEQLYSIGGVALTDHLLSTLKSEYTISFCEIVLRGLANNKIKSKPIGSELKSASLEFHQGEVIYTIFKSNSKWFCDNQRLEQAISQMAQNYIGKLLATASKTNNEAIKFGVSGVVATYEQQVRAMHESTQSVMTTRLNIGKDVGFFINYFPYKIKSEELEKYLDSIESLIVNLNTLPLKHNQPVLNP